MQKTILLIIVPLLFTFIMIGMMLNKPTLEKKTRVLLLGTIHFNNPNIDQFNPETRDIFSKESQRDLDVLVDRLSTLNISKIFVEREPSMQENLDSLMQEYVSGDYALGRNEVYQIGFRLAKRLQHHQVYAVDDQTTDFDFEKIQAYAANHQQMHFIDQLNLLGTTLVDKINKLFQHNSIMQALAYINTDKMLKENSRYYTEYLVRIGSAAEPIGTETVAEWYKRNLLIYSNILRILDENDQTIIVVYGHGHIPFLKYLFEENLAFEVINTSEFLLSE